jgi:outer membrane protein
MSNMKSLRPASLQRGITSYLLLFGLIAGLQSQELLTLDRSLEFAVENSPAMQQTELALIRSQEKLNAQRARLKSRFGVSLSPFQYQKTNRFDQQTSEWYLNESASSSGTFSINQRILPTDGVISLRNTFSYDYSNTGSALAMNPISRTFNNNLNLTITQPIFTYNRSKMELEMVELDYEGALIRYLLQKLNLEREVAQDFYSVYSSQMRLSIVGLELENNQDSYVIIKNKVEGGLLALEELYQAEVNLATSESSVFNAELIMLNTIDRFKVLIGLPLPDTIMIMADIQADTVVVDQAMALEHALAHRMELREREIDLQNSMFNLIQAKSVNEFSGSVSASIGVQAYDEQFNQLFNTPTNTPSAGITFEIPIFDWGERRSEIKAAEASMKSAEIQFEVEKIDIEVNIRSIVRSLKNLENQIVIQTKTVENAQLTYDINLERYRNGDLTSLDLGIYQNQLSDKKMALTNAIINYKIELLNLKIQSLYDFENQMPFIPDEIAGK